MESSYLDRPLNFAHRGASHETPENTLVAFLLAADLGADGIEFDVQITKDGEVVVIHNLTLEATTNGHGQVGAKTLAELSELDAGGWFDPVFAGQRIPTLQQVIEAVGHRLLLNIELKSVSPRDDGLAQAVVRAVEENHLLDQVVISSFNPFPLRRVKQLNPWIPVGLLYAAGMPFFMRRPWARHLINPQALHPHHSLVDGQYLRWSRDRGYRVHTWTVDDPGEMWRLARRGVDLIITNRPELLNQVLSNQPGTGQEAAQQMLPAARSREGSTGNSGGE